MNEKKGKGVCRFPSYAELPNQILVDIITRLPIKAVIHCKSVCKSFLHTISQDPEFPPLHISRSPPELFLLGPGSKKMILVDYDDEEAHELNFQFSGMSTMKLVNSCRGLLCLRPRYYSFEDVCVLNPLTLEYTLVPNPMMREKELHVWVAFGLGYSQKTDKYKVIKLTKFRDSTGKKNFLTDIYTLGTPPPPSSAASSSSSSPPPTPTLWRRIENAPVDEFTCCFSAFLNGSLHWIQNEGKSVYKYDYLLSFDFDNETFGKVYLPSPFVGGQERDRVDVVSIGVFEGCLSVNVLSTDEESLDVWVMKEYGVPESWVREIVVETPHFIWTSGSFPVRYLNSAKTELLIFIAEYDLVTYNLIENRIVKRNGFPSQNYESKAFIHTTPNLISLNEQLVEVHHLKTTKRKTWRRCEGWSVSEENSSSSSDSSSSSESEYESSSVDEIISISSYQPSDFDSNSSSSGGSGSSVSQGSGFSQESA